MNIVWSLNDLLTNAGAVATVIVTVVGLVTGWVRWLRRQRKSDIREEGPPLAFSRQNREALNDRIWSQRIVNGLERSLQYSTELQLELRSTPELLEPSYAQLVGEPGRIFSVQDAHAEAGQQLLIVGSPGSGKTTEALRLVRHLLEKAREDPRAPIPEIFPLSSWATERKPLLDWLARELHVRHGRPLREAYSLIVHHDVVPVLDGLDEVPADHRADCVEGINRFWEGHRGGPLVVCSRRTEYEGLEIRLRLGGAVAISPLDDMQIDQYLAGGGPRWTPVRTALKNGSASDLHALLATPLTLSIAMLAYENEDPAGLCMDDGDALSRRDNLWSRYVSAMITRSYVAQYQGQGQESSYSPASVRRWLGWLAHGMWSRGETELWLHEWTGPRTFRVKVRIILALAGGTVGGLFGASMGGPVITTSFAVIGALIFGAATNPVPTSRVPTNVRQLVHRLIEGAASGLLGGLLASLIYLGLITNMATVPILIVLALGASLLIRKWASHGSSAHATRSRVTWRVGAAVLVGGLGAAATQGNVRVGLLGATMALAVSGVILSPDRDARQRRMLILGSSIVLGSVGFFSPLSETLIHGVFKAQTQPNGQDLFNLLGFRFSMRGSTSTAVAVTVAGMIFGLIGGLLSGMINGLLAFGPDRARVVPRYPPEPLRKSAQIGLAIGLGAGTVTVLTTSLASVGSATGDFRQEVLVLGALVALFAGLVLGLDAVVFHYSFRIWMWLHNASPLRWTAFLEWARSHLLLQSAGASYSWINLELRDFLAKQYATAELIPGAASQEHETTRAETVRDPSGAV